MADPSPSVAAGRLFRHAKAALAAGRLDEAAALLAEADALLPAQAQLHALRLEINAARRAAGASGAAASASGVPRGGEPKPSASSASMHHRHGHTGGDGATSSHRPAGGGGSAGGGADAREAVARVLARPDDLYGVLGISRTATEAEIKKSYRRLALALHPDKCGEARAEAAFQAVTAAHAVLCDADKRAAYDRYGHADGAEGARRRAAAAHAAAYAAHFGGARGGGGQGFDSVDDLLRAFFGGGAGGFAAAARQQQQQQQQQHAHSAAFRAAAAARAAQQQQQQQQQPEGVAAVVTLLAPLLLLFLFLVVLPSLFSPPPTHSMRRSPDFPFQMATAKRGVPFYVAGGSSFDDALPPHSPQRRRAEAEMERTYGDFLARKCEQEATAARLRAFGWGGAGAADTARPACDELLSKYSDLYTRY